MYKRILVPLDGSKIAEAALPHALELAQRYDAQMSLLRVVQPVNIPSYYTTTIDLIKETEEQALKFAKEYLGTFANAIQDDGLEVTTEVILGNPQKEILNYVDQTDIDLIVMTA